MFWVYMVQNKGRQLYVGVTDNPNRRLDEHNHKKGANFTKNNSSFEVVFLEKYNSFTEARKREIQLKKWRRDKKEELIKRYSLRLETKI